MKGLTLAVVSLVAVLTLAGAAGAGGKTTGDGGAPVASYDAESALVQLNGEPLATYEQTRPAAGRKIDFNGSTTRAYRAHLAALRNDFKAWLRANAPKAKVVGEYDIALNAVAVRLNGESLETIRSAPLVRAAEYQGIYRPADADPDLALIDAVAAWNASGGVATAGENVSVAIVDSGIDVGHPCFSDAGYPTRQRVGTHSLTNNKVIAAKVFNNKAGSRGYTPEDFNGHGTHVAGTVACNYNTPATVSGVFIPYGVSGVAPRALLGNYNVFPGDVGSARSEDILNALEAAYADGFDVANMSLGGGSSGIQDLLTMAVDNLDVANMVVAVAAGNSGPDKFTVESPGMAARALTAGASTVPHFVGAPVDVAGGTYGAASGDFATVSTDVTLPLGVVTTASGLLSNACTTGFGAHGAPAAGSLTGEIALISRGACTFSEKIRNAENAGAKAVLVVNNVAGDPIAMGLGGIANEPTVPAYMVAMQHRAALMAADGESATISAAMEYFSTSNADIRAGFSSAGPTDVDRRVKPDVMAPGVNVLSAQPATVCGLNCWAFYQGTSMATPHLAGTAAFLLSRVPAGTLSAAQVRSMIVNTADEGVVTAHTDGTTVLTDVNLVGTGRQNVLSALNAKVALDPVSVSFGLIPSGSAVSRTKTIALSSVGGGAAASVAVTDRSDAGITFTASLSGATITVGASASHGAAIGHHQAILRVYDASGNELAHAPLYVFVGA